MVICQLHRTSVTQSFLAGFRASTKIVSANAPVQTTKPQMDENKTTKSVQPNYGKVFCSQPEPHFKTTSTNLRATNSHSQTTIGNSTTWKLQDHEWTNNPATKQKVARAKNNPETTKLAGRQFVVFFLECLISRQMLIEKVCVRVSEDVAHWWAKGWAMKGVM